MPLCHQNMLDVAIKHEAKSTSFSHTAFCLYPGPTTHLFSVRNSYHFSKNLFATIESLRDC